MYSSFNLYERMLNNTNFRDFLCLFDLIMVYFSFN